MKRYNVVLGASFLGYFLLAVLSYFFLENGSAGENVGYKVEINKMMQGLEKEDIFSKPDLRKRDYVKEVSFLPAGAETEQEMRVFYQNRNGLNTAVYPLWADGTFLGYVRFDYVTGGGNKKLIWLTEGVLFFSWLFLTAVLWFIRKKVLKPFHVLSEMPYELSKGNLQVELEESKNRFFGRFIWGIGMLRDTLKASKSRELKLEKEKKLLLLSVSHDIKIPLSAIKLYAKALKEGMYGTEEERNHAAGQIERHAVEIEEFVKEIVHAASEDILAIEVADSEFYLKDFAEKIRECYEPKCRVVMTNFRMGGYENKLLKGDMDRAFETVENLMENAFKYGDGKEIGVEFYEEDYCQVVRVFNTGEAVPEEEMPHLFDSFYRGSNVGSREGNGLGLYINKQIMNKMEGEIFAKREKSGMSFYLVFCILL